MKLDPETASHLEEWADWSRGGEIKLEGGAEGYLKERLDQAADSAEFTPEIELTDKALAQVYRDDRVILRGKRSKRGWKSVIKRYYLDRQSPYEVAKNLGFTEGYVKSLLEGAVERVRYWRNRLAKCN